MQVRAGEGEQRESDPLGHAHGPTAARLDADAHREQEAHHDGQHRP